MLQGADVGKVQRIVKAQEDNLYGPNTATKVRGWQATHRLVADGVVGPKTATALGE